MVDLSINLSWIDGRHVAGLISIGLLLGLGFVFRAELQRQAHRRDQHTANAAPAGKPPGRHRAYEPAPSGVDVELRSDGAELVVTAAPPEAVISGMVIREARAGSRWVMSFTMSDGATMLRFGTEGKGEGIVAYRIGLMASRDPDTWHATRVELQPPAEPDAEPDAASARAEA